jgi:hypothetical protein
MLRVASQNTNRKVGKGTGTAHVAGAANHASLVAEVERSRIDVFLERGHVWLLANPHARAGKPRCSSMGFEPCCEPCVVA